MEITFKKENANGTTFEATIVDTGGCVKVTYTENGEFVGGFLTASINGAIDRVRKELGC